MIYEVRTYTLRPGAVAEFEERYAKRLPAREKHSKLGAFWHTEFGPLNQVVHVYPYDDLNHRTARARRRWRKDAERNALPGGRRPDRGPGSRDHDPAPFMRALGSRDYGTGNVYEMRTYTYAPGDLPKVLEAWAKAIGARGALAVGGLLDAASSAGSTSSSTPGSTRTSTNAPVSVRTRRPGRRVAAAGRRAAGPARKQAADPGLLLTGPVVRRIEPGWSRVQLRRAARARHRRRHAPSGARVEDVAETITEQVEPERRDRQRQPRERRDPPLVPQVVPPDGASRPIPATAAAPPSQ